MENRFQRKEKSAVRSRFGKHELFLFMEQPCAYYEKESAKFKLSTEELFYECMAVLDRIKDDPDNAPIWIESVWDNLYNEFNETEKEYDDTDVRTSVSEVVACLCCCLNACEGVYYNNLNIKLMLQLTDNLPNVQGMLDRFTHTMYKLGEERFEDAVKEYMDSNDFFSEDIKEIRLGIDSPEQLSITQCIFLFAGLLDISINKEYTSSIELAKFISQVTPYELKSIKTRISELQIIIKKNGFKGKISDDIVRVAKKIKVLNDVKAKELMSEYVE